MIASEKSHQNISDYNKFLFRKKFEVNQKNCFSSEKMRISGNCIYVYSHMIFNRMCYTSNSL